MDWKRIDQLINLSRLSLGPELENLRPLNPERRRYYRFLYHLVRELQPKIALEIGVESGLASIHMAEAAKSFGGLVIGIDIQPCRHPLGNYEFIQASSLEAAGYVEMLVREHGSIGLVYQDSSHHYEESRQEWALYSPMLDHRAVWICDDITPAFHDPKVDPPGLGMVQYFEGLPGDKRLYPNVLHFGNTQGIVLLNGR